MSRLTRREMKRDEVREGVTHAVDYLRLHAREMMFALVAVVVVVIAIGGWLAYRSQRATAANFELARAIKVYQAPIDAVAPQPEDEASPSFADETSRMAAARAAFESIRSRFGGSRVGAVAAAYLADLATRAGDLDEARSLWGEAARGKQTLLSAQILLNRLAADRAEGRGEEVLAELRGMLEDDSSALPPVVVLDQMATTLETLGREDEAREIYQRIVDEHPQTAYSQRARQRTQAL